MRSIFVVINPGNQPIQYLLLFRITPLMLNEYPMNIYTQIFANCGVSAFLCQVISRIPETHDQERYSKWKRCPLNN